MTATAPQSATENKPAKTPTVPKIKQCACLNGTGKTCPDTTQKAFHQGHDARMASRLAQAVAAGTMELDAAKKLITDAGGSDLLVGKMAHSAQLRKAKAEAPPKVRTPKTPKATAKGEGGTKADSEQAATVATAGKSLMGSKVKAKHGDKDYDAVVVRNASEKIVARHRLQGKNCDHDVNDEGVVTE